MSEKDKIKNDASEESASSESSLELIMTNTKTEKTQGENAVDMNLYDFDLDTIKDKPWLNPGADITDYFNYGFTEKTWKKYCDMQRDNRAFVEKEEKSTEWNPRDQRYPQRQEDRYGKRRRTNEEWYPRGYRRY